ncbi:MAG: peptidylprolyl isomerase [Methylacidiphilales bacterium]|nr:peptidylprolyl isomerase [Candidatus Methylacidiphilales bacterium]NJR18669.1 peptidylprolyl isomerase [Calothrix sp. CSU_2_0]
MDSSLFLTANEQPISLEQGLRYLESAGKLESVIWEIIRQHILEEELQSIESIEEIETSDEIIEQVIVNFRLDNQLTNSESFQEWLDSEGIDDAIFRQQIVDSLKLDALKIRVTEANLQEYFIERKIFLDRVIISRLVVEESALAEELKSQIVEDGVSFEQLVREYSVAEDAVFNGMMGAVNRGSLPDELRVAIDLANPGDLLGPLDIDGLWYLVRVEKFLPVSLDEQVKQELEDELFEQWLEEKVKNINVQFQVKF